MNMQILVKSIESLKKEFPTSRTPILTYCRQLVKDNIYPKTELHVTRMDIDSIIIKDIYAAAKITVLESDKEGPKFVRYKEFKI